jgi:hypothetical protein
LKFIKKQPPLLSIFASYCVDMKTAKNYTLLFALFFPYPLDVFSHKGEKANLKIKKQ